jgi:predicted 3-demethylubiquinone-9 3-methyltransferase (glyoxalase superfamily)
MKSITPCIWFDSVAKDAADFYVATFDDARIIQTSYYPESAEEVSGKKAGDVLTVVFEIKGQQYMALNGGKEFPLSEAVSFMINCESQEEVDRYWAALTSDGGEESMCGWCKDKFGLSWQVIPAGMENYLNDPDKDKADKAMAAMLSMKKIDLEAIRRASER